MIKYKVKKYYLKEAGDTGRYTIWAEIIKYRFGFVVDIYDEQLRWDYTIPHQKIYYRTLQEPRDKEYLENVILGLKTKLK